MRPVRLELRYVPGETMIFDDLTSEEILQDAVEFLGRMNEADPQGFEAEQARRQSELESKGYR